MRSASPDVVSYLNGIIAGTYPPEGYLSDLFSITPVDQSSIYITSFDRNVTWNSITYSVGGTLNPHNTPYAQRQTWRISNTLDVDTIELLLASTPAQTLNGTTFLGAVRQGYLDNAYVLVERFIQAPCQVASDSTGLNLTLVSGPPFPVSVWPTGSGTHPIVGSTAIVDGISVKITGFTDSTHIAISPGVRASVTLNAIIPVGTVTLFAGYWFEPEIRRTTCKATVKSALIRLDIGIPRKIIGPDCSHTLFDPGCGLLQSNYQYTATVLSGTTQWQVVTGLTPAGIIDPPANLPSWGSVAQTSPVKTFNIPSATYWIKQSYVYELGETPCGLQQTEAIIADATQQNLQANGALVVYAPPRDSGSVATGWNVYIATDTGPNMLQNSAPLLFGPYPGGGRTYPYVHSSQGGQPPLAGYDWQIGNIGTTTGVYPQFQNSQGMYAQGFMQFTSGALTGQRFAIKANTGGTLYPEIPLPIAPIPGDTLFVVPGCDLTMASCINKFNSPASGPPLTANVGNIIHFGGMPWTPSPEKGFTGQGVGESA